MNESVKTSEMSKSDFVYIIKVDKDRHESHYEINKNIKWLHKELADTK